MKRFLLIILVSIFAVTMAHAKSVTLSWDPSPSDGVTGYILYQHTSPDQPFPIVLDVGDVLTFTVDGLDNEVGYYFGVAAYNAVGQESVYSNIVYSPAFAPPAAPVGLHGTTTVNNIDVPLE